MTDTRQKFRKMLREGQLDDKEIEVELQAMSVGVEIMAPPGRGRRRCTRATRGRD